MNFDVARNRQLNDHLDSISCDCEDGEFCDVCDPAEASQRDQEERAELRADE